MHVEVYHADPYNPLLAMLGDTIPAWPDGYKRVAVVALADDTPVHEALEWAYRLTNHIDRPWWENDCVALIGPECRSTSVGDMVVVEDRRFRCENAGWKEVQA